MNISVETYQLIKTILCLGYRQDTENVRFYERYSSIFQFMRHPSRPFFCDIGFTGMFQPKEIAYYNTRGLAIVFNFECSDRMRIQTLFGCIEDIKNHRINPQGRR